ncbi:uncharacterized protein LOC125046515 [Penaeus chinensis]|uniref:uncharacterized protein LOC125046515 n=1 Tax=Penaeus chinensis TaxID=139456 RepID=UPI001FB6064B|nr:uncharacterized protein LOC125046515 [Penaeus chinensis]
MVERGRQIQQQQQREQQHKQHHQESLQQHRDPAMPSTQTKYSCRSLGEQNTTGLEEGKIEESAAAAAEAEAAVVRGPRDTPPLDKSGTSKAPRGLRAEERPQTHTQHNVPPRSRRKPAEQRHRSPLPVIGDRNVPRDHDDTATPPPATARPLVDSGCAPVSPSLPGRQLISAMTYARPGRRGRPRQDHELTADSGLPVDITFSPVSLSTSINLPSSCRGSIERSSLQTRYLRGPGTEADPTRRLRLELQPAKPRRSPLRPPRCKSQLGAIKVWFIAAVQDALYFPVKHTPLNQAKARNIKPRQAKATPTKTMQPSATQAPPSPVHASGRLAGPSTCVMDDPGAQEEGMASGQEVGVAKMTRPLTEDNDKRQGTEGTEGTELGTSKEQRGKAGGKKQGQEAGARSRGDRAAAAAAASAPGAFFVDAPVPASVMPVFLFCSCCLCSCCVCVCCCPSYCPRSCFC